jgi:urease accessory protein
MIPDDRRKLLPLFATAGAAAPDPSSIADLGRAWQSGRASCRLIRHMPQFEAKSADFPSLIRTGIWLPACIIRALSQKIDRMNALRPLTPSAPVRLMLPRLERSAGTARISVLFDGDRSRLGRLYQSGAARILLPRVAVDSPVEAVLINTAGGLTGGDRLGIEVEVGSGAKAALTTQAAERIYRRSGGVAEIDAYLTVGGGARLDWLPQETILFDRSALSRRLIADIAPTATLLAAEAVILGRAAMGETVRQVSLTDSWRIRRGGRLIFADGVRIEGDAASIMSGRATGGGAVAFATLVLVSPDAETMLDAARAELEGCAGEAGVSARNGMLVARLIAPTGQALRTDLIRLVAALRRTPMPRVWQC